MSDSVDSYLSFLDRMGHNIRECAGVYWFDAHPRVYMSIPYQTLLKPLNVDVRKILGNDGVVLRYPCEIEFGKNSYQIVVDDPGYDFGALQPRKRTQTRRGLERCEVRCLDFSELINAGIRLNRETLARQGRVIPAGFDSYWQKYYREAALTDSAEAWGAFVDGVLAAYLIAFRIDGVSHILILRSSIAMLEYFPNNALMFRYIRTVIQEGSVHEVSYGFEPIQGEIKSLEQFKVSMGFRLRPVGQRVEFSPGIGNLMKGPIGGAVRWILNKSPHRGEKIGKLAGLVRWHSEQPE